MCGISFIPGTCDSIHFTELSPIQWKSFQAQQLYNSLKYRQMPTILREKKVFT